MANKKRKGEPPKTWRLHFFQRHRDDDPTCSVPAMQFLEACPQKVRAGIYAVLRAVVEAPPPSFSGGGKWEAMHGDMAGYYEVRENGPQRHHYRLFCLLERDGAKAGLGGESLVAICGKDKPFQTVLSDEEYAQVRALGDEYKKRKPRSVFQG